MRVVVASGKGGTGKTFVATNLFYTLKSDNYSVAIADCDAEVPNVAPFIPGKQSWQKEVKQFLPIIYPEKCTYCGKCVEYCYYNAIFMSAEAKIIKLLEELCHGCGACEVACEFGAIEESEKSIGTVSLYSIDNNFPFAEGRIFPGEASPVPVIKETVKSITAEGREFTIVDAPPGTSCPFVEAVSGADWVILVAEPTPFGLSDLKQSVETLRILELPFGVIINRAGLGDRAIYQYLEEESIELIAEIPYSKEIAYHYSNGAMAVEKLPELKNKFREIIKRIEQYGDSNN